MATTERGEFRFVVKDLENDAFFIAAEPGGQVLESLRGDLLCFDLRPGTRDGTRDRKVSQRAHRCDHTDL
jgi:hypothetical protein